MVVEVNLLIVDLSNCLNLGGSTAIRNAVIMLFRSYRRLYRLNIWINYLEVDRKCMYKPLIMPI